jgi:hypothetical protein
MERHAAAIRGAFAPDAYAAFASQVQLFDLEAGLAMLKAAASGQGISLAETVC